MLTPRISRRSWLALALLLAAIVFVPLSGCRSTIPNRNPVGERFPEVRGNSLKDEEVALPRTGQPTILLVGYLQEAQFDADRWCFGLLQAATPVALFEVPTLPGLIPSLASGFIDAGMQSGIPSEDWSSVVTVYGGPAATIAEFTGNTQGRNMRVLLLDDQGVVRWFHDRGFSAGKLLELDRAARELAGPR